jgi:putative transposase
MGMLLRVLVTGADVQDRDGACELIAEQFDEKEWVLLEEFVADAGYRGEKVETAAFVAGQWDVRIVTRRDDQKGFEVQPIRWIVERTFAWLSRCRRLAKDVERTVESATGFIYFAMIRIMARRLTEVEG